MKQHVQVYTDTVRAGRMPLTMPYRKELPNDVLEPKPDREVMNAERLFSTARELRDVAAGVLFSVRRGWPGETVRHGLLHRGANIRSRMWHCRRLTVTASQQVSG